MTISSNSLYGASSYATYGSSTSSSSSLGSQFAEALLTSMDSDGSGSVDSTEFSSTALALSISDESAISSAFSSLDSDGDGTISEEELSTLFSEESTRLVGGMPPPPPPPRSPEEDTGYTAEELTAMAEESTSTDSNLASLLASIVENFDAADTDGDGKVTSAEAMAYQQSTQETTDATETSSAVSAAGGMPPPPPPSSSTGVEDDEGYTEEELLAMVDEVSQTDSNLASLFETLAANFDEADTNEDGKVSSTEAQAYKDSTKAASIGASEVTTEKTSDDSLMKALLAQIISNYSTQNSLSGSSVSFSA